MPKAGIRGVSLSSDALVIRGGLALEYVIPLRRPFATARSVRTNARNFIVKLDAEHGGRPLSGLGEATPRGRLITGDFEEKSWNFLVGALQKVTDQSLSIESPCSARTEIRRYMESLHDYASDCAAGIHPRPFRGTLCGIEMAMLDLVSKALGLPLASFLGRRRSEPVISASTFSAMNEPAEIERRMRSRRRHYPVYQFKGTGELGRDLEVLRIAAAVLRQEGVEKPLWLDANGAYSTSGAAELVAALATLMRTSVLPPEMIFEEPVFCSLECLPSLQRQADKLLEGTGRTLLIMADESVWDEDDISKLMADGGCRAINLKIQKAGGVLPCLRGAEAAVAANPDIRIYVGNMMGTSALTTRTLSSLAMASPRLDYFTAITNPLSGLTVREALGDEGRGTSARSPSHGGAQAEAGLGAELDLGVLPPI